MAAFNCGILILAVIFCTAVSDAVPPNIVFIVADDLGWNDVGFHNKHVISPNIDKLASLGIKLDQSYVQPVCTPSRTAFMTGMYPFKVGRQLYLGRNNKLDESKVGGTTEETSFDFHWKMGEMDRTHGAMLPEQASCAAMNHSTLAEKLKRGGYATHIIGKWHLGFCKWECTPTYRGFDSFYGFYNGQDDYYNYTVLNGVDFRDNKDRKKPTEYSTYAFAKRADEIIKNHNKSQPLFLYYPFQSVHEPIQVPKYYEDKYKDVKNNGRRKFLGMVTAMDDAIGNLTESLRQNGLFDNTVIVFTADNGGWPTFYGNNFPLRGSKITVYEGGTRASAFIYGKGLQKTGTTYTGLMHAVDWMPTLLSAAGLPKVDNIDGIDMWESLTMGSPSNRNEFIYNLDDKFPPLNGHAAIRVGDYKLIEGYPGPYNGWYPPPEDNNTKPVTEDKEIPDFPQLYNLKDDPNEHKNLYHDEKEIYQKLKAKMEDYKKEMVPADWPPNDKKGNPDNFGGYWSPGWC